MVAVLLGVLVATGAGTATAADPAPSADLAMNGIFGPSTLVPGSSERYVVDFRNNGPAPASGVVVRMTVPAGVSLMFTDGLCTQVGQVLTCSIEPSDEVEPGQVFSFSPTLTLAPDVRENTVLSLTAEVSAATPDPDQSNNAASLDVEADDTVADLSINIEAPSKVVAGSTVTWFISYQNDGPSASLETMVSAILDSRQTFLSAPIDCRVVGSQLSCWYPQEDPLPPGHGIGFGLTMQVPPDLPPGTRLSLTVTTSGDPRDPVSRDNIATATAPPSQAAPEPTPTPTHTTEPTATTGPTQQPTCPELPSSSPPCPEPTLTEEPTAEPTSEPSTEPTVERTPTGTPTVTPTSEPTTVVVEGTQHSQPSTTAPAAATLPRTGGNVPWWLGLAALTLVGLGVAMRRLPR
jgi:uncharacterized repeat protein (TIGR01451 family)